MPAEWYFMQMGDVVGPLSAAELRQYARDGKLTRDTYVRKGGEGHWVSAERVKDLWENLGRELGSITPPHLQAPKNPDTGSTPAIITSSFPKGEEKQSEIGKHERLPNKFRIAAAVLAIVAIVAAVLWFAVRRTDDDVIKYHYDNCLRLNDRYKESIADLYKWNNTVFPLLPKSEAARTKRQKAAELSPLIREMEDELAELRKLKQRHSGNQRATRMIDTMLGLEEVHANARQLHDLLRSQASELEPMP